MDSHRGNKWVTRGFVAVILGAFLVGVVLNNLDDTTTPPRPAALVTAQ